MQACLTDLTGRPAGRRNENYLFARQLCAQVIYYNLPLLTNIATIILIDMRMNLRLLIILNKSGK